MATKAQQDIQDQKDAIEAVRLRELDRERAAGKKEAEDDARDKETAAHFATINGSIADTAESLALVVKRLDSMEAKRAEETAVSVALSKYLNEQKDNAITTTRLWFAVAAIVIPVILAVVLAIVTH